ncbi:MAG: hypothetical protein AB9819_01930 [Methanomassiliicoccales archaeon]
MNSIEYLHASVYGNGAQVAEEFKKQMAVRGIEVSVHHIDDMRTNTMRPTDLYVFSTPGRFGKPIKGMRRFLKDLELPKGTRCAVLTTEPSPQPDKKTGKVPSDDEIGRCQHVLPMMLESLKDKDLVTIVSTKVYVTGLKGPLETGWQEKVRNFTDTIISASDL